MNKKRKIEKKLPFEHVLQRLTTTNKDLLSTEELRIILTRQKTWGSYTMLQMADLLGERKRNSEYFDICIELCYRFTKRAIYYLLRKRGEVKPVLAAKKEQDTAIREIHVNELGELGL